MRIPLDLLLHMTATCSVRQHNASSISASSIPSRRHRDLDTLDIRDIIIQHNRLSKARSASYSHIHEALNCEVANYLHNIPAHENLLNNLRNASSRRLSSAMAQPANSFLSLLQEIRDNIYSFLPSTALLPLVLSCRQLHAEAQPLFYARNVLSIEPILMK